MNSLMWLGIVILMFSFLLTISNGPRLVEFADDNNARK